MTGGKSISAPIYLSFAESRDGSFYFILEKNITTEKFFLKVRWVSAKQEPQFDGSHNTLKFLINRDELIDLLPIAAPKIASYNIENGSLEEEAMYSISREQLETIAAAKFVVAELSGKYNKVSVGRFNRLHTTMAFREFLKNS